MQPEQQSITEEARVYLYKGEDLYEKGKYNEAICELDKALAINES
jgi:tetratricopeptide (TPR) repeat protein